MALKIFGTKRALNNFDKILEYLEKELGETTRTFAIKAHNFINNLQDFTKREHFKIQKSKFTDSPL